MRIVKKMHAIYRQSLFSLGFPLDQILGTRKNFILLYHGVVSQKNNPFNSRHTHIEDFEHQIRYLKRHANIISVKDFFNGRFNPTKCNIAITFDDAFYNNVLHALPILERYEVPVTLFTTCLFNQTNPFIFADFIQVASQFTNDPITICGDRYIKKNHQFYREEDGCSMIELLKQEHFNEASQNEIYNHWQSIFERHKVKTEPYWKIMTSNEIVHASRNNLVTIGSHTCKHNNMEKLPIQSAIEDLKKSKSILENLIQKQVDEFAYPYGLFSEEIVVEAKKIGYHYQLGTEDNKIESYIDHPDIKGRKGVYQCATWGNQLI